MSNDFKKDVFQRCLFDGVFRKVALRGQDVEEAGKGHVIVTVVTNTTFIADATIAFANQHFESGGDVVGETCARYATHEHLGSDRVFPCRTRKVDLIRGITRGEFLGRANGYCGG